MVRDRSLAFKTFLSLGCLLALVTVMVAWLVIAQEKVLLEKGFDDKLGAVAMGSRNMFHQAAAAYCESEGMRYHRVRAGQAAQGPEGDFERASLAAFAQDPSLTLRSTELKAADGTAFRYLLSPARLREECVRCHGAMGVTALKEHRPGDLVAVFGVSMPTTGLHRQVARTEVAAGLLGLALLGLASWIVSITVHRVILKPLGAISRACGRLAPGANENSPRAAREKPPTNV